MRKLLFAPFILILANSSLAWEYNYQKDALTDHEVISATMSATGRLLGSNERVLTVLQIGCGSEGPYFSFQYGARTTEGLFRFDDSDPIAIQPFLNFDDFHASLYTGESAIELIERTKAAKKLVVRRQDLSALTQSDHVFDLRSSFRPVTRALSPCYAL